MLLLHARFDQRCRMSVQRAEAFQQQRSIEWHQQHPTSCSWPQLSVVLWTCTKQVPNKAEDRIDVRQYHTSCNTMNTQASVYWMWIFNIPKASAPGIFWNQTHEATLLHCARARSGTSHRQISIQASKTPGIDPDKLQCSLGVLTQAEGNHEGLHQIRHALLLDFNGKEEVYVSDQVQLLPCLLMRRICDTGNPIHRWQGRQQSRFIARV